MSDFQQNSHSNITFDYDSYTSSFLIGLLPQMLHFSSTHPVSIKPLPKDIIDHKNVCAIGSIFL